MYSPTNSIKFSVYTTSPITLMILTSRFWTSSDVNDTLNTSLDGLGSKLLLYHLQVSRCHLIQITGPSQTGDLWTSCNTMFSTLLCEFLELIHSSASLLMVKTPNPPILENEDPGTFSLYCNLEWIWVLYPNRMLSL